MDSLAKAERRHPTAGDFNEAIPALMALFAVGRAALRLARDESVSSSEVATKVAELDALIRSNANLLTEVNASYRELLPEVEPSSVVPNCAGWTADSMHEAIWFWVAHGVVQAGADRDKLASMPIPVDADVLPPLPREMRKISRLLRDLEMRIATAPTPANRLRRIADDFNVLATKALSPADFGTAAGALIYEAFEEEVFNSDPPQGVLDPSQSVADFRVEIRARRANNPPGSESESIGWLGCFMYAIEFFHRPGDDGNNAAGITCRRLAEYVRQHAKRIERDGERTIPPTSDTVVGTGGSGRESSAKPSRKPTINARMLVKMQATTEAMGWSSTKWAKELRCAKSSVVETKAWKDLKMLRDRERSERARDRRRRPKASDRHRD